MARLYDMPDGETINLDNVEQVGKLFINKNFPEYNCYEVYFSTGRDSIGVFENDLPRAQFLIEWAG